MHTHFHLSTLKHKEPTGLLSILPYLEKCHYSNCVTTLSAHTHQSNQFLRGWMLCQGLYPVVLLDGSHLLPLYVTMPFCNLVSHQNVSATLGHRAKHISFTLMPLNYEIHVFFLFVCFWPILHYWPAGCYGCWNHWCYSDMDMFPILATLPKRSHKYLWHLSWHLVCDVICSQSLHSRVVGRMMLRNKIFFYIVNN